MFANRVVKPIFVALFMLALFGLGACDSGDDAGAPAASTAANAESGSEAAVSPAEPEAQRAVFSDQLPYAEVDDELVYGHFVFPSDMIDPLPAVVMIHGRWGLDDDMRARADRLAAEGYIVLAVDLFQGKTARDAAEARELMTSVIEDPDSAAGNIQSAVEFVAATAGAPRTAALGWGFGGTWAVNTAALMPDDLHAAVVYYGQVSSDEEKLRPIAAPILGLFGGEDRVVKSESVEALRTSLDRLRKEYEIKIYPAAGSEFVNPSSNNYNPGAARDAWQRMLDFLRTHLAEAEAAS